MVLDIATTLFPDKLTIEAEDILTLLKVSAESHISLLQAMKLMIIWWYCSVMCKCSTYNRRGNSLCARWNCNAIQPDANGTSKSKAFTFCYFSCLFSTESNFIFRWRCFVRHVLFATFPNVTERTHLCKKTRHFSFKKARACPNSVPCSDGQSFILTCASKSCK